MSRVSSESVQYRDRADIVDAYAQRGIPAFAIWQQKQFMFEFSDDDIEMGKKMLAEILQRLYKNKSAAIYTLCVYKQKVIPEDGIDSDTPYHGSFNFRLSDEVYGFNTGENLALKQEIELLKAKLQEMENAEDDEPVPMQKTIMGQVQEVLANPLLQPLIVPLVERIAGFIVPPKKEPGELDEDGKVRKISGMPNSEDRIRAAVETLNKKIDDLPDVLEKLALMSERSPLTFKMYIVAFRAMQI